MCIRDSIGPEEVSLHPDEAPESSPTTGASSRSEVVGVDRCDRCTDPARAWWAPLTTDLDERALMLCAQHSTEHAEALVDAGWVLVADEVEVVA